MKKRVFAFTALLVLVACARNQEVDIPEPDMTLFARTEEPAGSKTIVESGTHVYWEPGDEIFVFSGGKSAKFVTDITTSAATATFKGTFGEETWAEGMDLWAVYPYSEDAVFDGETITTVLPSEQVARAGSFGKDMNLAIAHSSTSTLQFYNVGGGVRFSVTEEGIKKVMFEGLSGEIISGKVKIGLDENGLPVVQEVSGGSQFITLLPPTGQETFEKDTWYYILAIPGALEGGYKLRFYKDTDYARKVSEKAVTIKRSIYGNIEKADEGIEYEAQRMHFPETKAEVEASIALTHSIGNSIQSIIYPQDETITDDEIKNELERIDGVVQAVVSFEEGVCSLMQKDSVWINYFIYDDDPSGVHDDLSLVEEYPDISQQVVSYQNKVKSIHRAMSVNSIDQDYTINNCRKALVLVPFYYDRRSLDIGFLITCLEGAGFSYSDIDIRINGPKHDEDILLPSWNFASITEFKGENLSKYDFILIYTHGGTGYYAQSLDGEYVNKQSSLSSGTEYSEGSVEQYILSGTFSWDEIAIGGVSAGKDESGKTIWEYYLGMTPKFLKDSHFDNSCVMLSACSSAEILNNKHGGSMVKTFLDKGAGIVYGYSKSVDSGYLNIPMTKRIIEFTSYGFSFQDAVRLYKESPISQSRYLNTKERWESSYIERGWTKKELKHNVASLDPEISYFELNKSLSGPYYLTDPFPHLNPADLISDPGYVLFTWDCNLKPFRDEINYVEIQDSEPQYTQYSVHYDIYVDGSRLGKTLYSDDTDKQASWQPSSYGDHTWYIVAKIMEGDTVIASYQSEVGKFTVTPVGSGGIDDVPGHDI